MNEHHRYRFVTGNQMIAEGAVDAGCRFFAGYPITPASGIYKTMIDLLQAKGDVAISAPDEISAIAYCVGASMRGFPAMTATSGPGWSLMIETVQYALMTETPVVIAYVQRLGPSTGGATQGGQGDLLLAEYCTSGGYTVPILAPSTAEECYALTARAFAWAETLRVPVVLLSDKEVGMTSERIDMARVAKPVRTDRAGADDASASWRTYAIHSPGDVPRFSRVGGPLPVKMTGSAHNMAGELKKNDEETVRLLHHLEEKVTCRAAELSVVDLVEELGARTLLISFGITARTMLEAAVRHRAGGGVVNTLSVKSLFPIPHAAIERAASRVQRVVIAEENFGGQYRSLLLSSLRGKEVVGINAIGSMISPKEIADAIL